MFLYDLVSSKSIVIPTIIFTIKRGESHILFITNKPKLLVRSHVVLDYTRNSVYLFEIPGGKYIIDIFSDALRRIDAYGALPYMYRIETTTRMTRPPQPETVEVQLHEVFFYFIFS